MLFDDEEAGIKAVEDLGPVFEWDGKTVQIDYQYNKDIAPWRRSIVIKDLPLLDDLEISLTRAGKENRKVLKDELANYFSEQFGEVLKVWV